MAADYSKLSTESLKALQAGDYSKLSIDELKHLQTQAPEATDSPKEMSKLESFLRGGEQGLTFGFGDELNAGAEALTSDKPYNQALGESRQAFKAAEETNPLTYKGGQFTGALGSLALPGVGAIGRVAEGASIGARALGAAKAGAAIGGITAVGDSEDKASMDTAKAALKGAAGGAAAGAVLGGAIPAVAKTLDTGASKLDYYNNLKRAYQAAKGGNSLIGQTEPLKAEMRDFARNDIVSGLESNRGNIGSKIGEIKRSGGPVDVSDAIPQMQEKLSAIAADSSGEGAAGVKNVQKLISDLADKAGLGAESEGAVPLSQAKLESARAELASTAGNAGKTPAERQAASAMLGDIKNLIASSMPEEAQADLANVNKMYTGQLDAQAKLGINTKNMSTSEAGRATREKAVDNVSSMIEDFSNKASDSRQQIKEAVDALRVQASTDPESGKKLQDMYDITKTVDPDALVNKIQQLSQDYKVSKQLTAQSSIDKSKNVIGGSVLQLSGKAIPMLSADVAGRAVALPGQLASKVVAGVSDIAKASPEMLQTVGQRLADKASPYAAQFQKVLQQPDSLRKAMLFTLMQQPGFRSDIEDKGP